jgi:hypothetical protein
MMLAYKSFDFYRTMCYLKIQMLFIILDLSAANGKNYPAAISNYNKLITTKFSKSTNVFIWIFLRFTLLSKDTVNALKTVSEGVTKYSATSSESTQKGN